MVVDFTERTSRLQLVTDKIEWTLTNIDRCDAGCSAQAFVKAIGVTGELMFCSHHYNKISNNAVGYANLEKFAYQIIDERERLIENRLVGDD
jgi:hypothetical protein